MHRVLPTCPLLRHQIPPLQITQMSPWKDLSGNGYDAVSFTSSSSKPKFDADGFNGKSTLAFTDDTLKLQNSQSDFDGWSELTVFAALYQTAYDDFRVIFGKNTQTGWPSHGNSLSWTLNMHRNMISSHKIWGPIINTDSPQLLYAQTGDTAIWSSGVNAGFNGGPSLITLRYSNTAGNFLWRINGRQKSKNNISGNILSSPTYPVTIAGNANESKEWNGNISEFIIYNAGFGDDQIEQMESYLSNKWGLNSKLPAAHYAQPYKGTDLTLHFGSSDGGTDANSWGQTISLGKNSPRLAIWLDGADSSSISKDASDMIEKWADKSGNDVNATQTNGSYKPKYIPAYLNNRSVVKFDGSNDKMTFSGTHTIQTLYLVLNSTDLGNFDGWRWPFSGYNNGGSKVDLGYGRAGQKDIGGNFAYIYGLGNTESENFRPLNAFKILKSEFGSPTERNQWKLGRGDDEWKGHIAEVIAYSESPTTSESEKIEGYLAHKWGLTEALPNSHPYKEICTVDSPKALASYSADISALVPGNTYYYRISASNSEGTHWSDATTSFVSQSSLDVNTGQLFFDTNGPTPRWYTADGQVEMEFYRQNRGRTVSPTPSITRWLNFRSPV